MYSYSCIIIYIHRYRRFEKEMPGSFVMRSVDLVNVDDAQVAAAVPGLTSKVLSSVASWTIPL
jgi:hypothetical protein